MHLAKMSLNIQSSWSFLEEKRTPLQLYLQFLTWSVTLTAWGVLYCNRRTLRDDDMVMIKSHIYLLSQRPGRSNRGLLRDNALVMHEVAIKNTTGFEIRNVMLPRTIVMSHQRRLGNLKITSLKHATN